MLRVVYVLTSIALLFSSVGIVLSQPHQHQLRGNSGGANRRKRKPSPLDAEAFSTIEVNYPMNIFDISSSSGEGGGGGGDSHRDWRSTAIFSSELREVSDRIDKAYLGFARAQDQEDVWLYENWFYGMTDGVIMESGALDGKLFSTSYMFEKFANWTSIHVEADPENYRNLKRNRGRAVNVHGALCSEPRLLHYSSEGVIPVRGFIEFMAPSFIKKWHGRVYNNKTRIEDLPTVQCLPVKLLLRELHVKHINLWILDTEGAEESVLKGTDFHAVHFDAVAMECDEHDVQKNERKTSILESNGFKCQLVERNCMCKHDRYVPSSAKSLSVLQKWDGQKWTQTYQQTLTSTANATSHAAAS